MLLLLLLLLPDGGSTESEPSVYVKSIEKCPQKGYFFDRNEARKFSSCYICFCKWSQRAFCRKIAVENCNALDYIHEESVNNHRYRRSLRLPDFFFKDAASEVVNANMVEHEECKALQSSKSIGCPPADWCKGCMVCECDSKSHWNCHRMSFCSTDKPESKTKTTETRKTPRAIPKKAGPKKKFALKRLKNAKKAKSNNNARAENVVTTTYEKNNKSMVGKSVKRYLKSDTISDASVITKKQFGTKKGQNSPLVIIKRYISTTSPLKSPELLMYKKDPRKIAQMFFKQFMLNKIPKNNQNFASKAPKKNKSHIIKQSKQNARKPVNTKAHKESLLIVSSKKRTGKKPESKRIRTKNSKGKKYKGTKYINDVRRNKRDAPFNITEDPGDVTNMTTETTDVTADSTVYDELITNATESALANSTVYDELITNATESALAISTVYDELITNATEISFTNNEASSTRLNKYAYVIDKYVTTRMNDSKSALDTSENNVIMSIDNLKNSTAREYNTNEDKTMVTEATIQNFNTITAEIDNSKENVSTNHIIMLKDSNENRFKSAPKAETTSKTFINITKTVQTPDNISTRTKINNTLLNIQEVLEKFIHGVSKNVSDNKPKYEHFTALKYLRKLFSKIFIHTRNKTAVDKINVIDSLCETFGPCKVNIKKMGIINSKVKKLMAETEKALNSIRIIKGLLELIENKNIKERNTTSKEAVFREHVKKLNAILKDNFVPDDQLTQTQATQINYIKSNTRVFIKSIAKFATTLNDIINLIKSENDKENNTSKSTKSKKRRYQQRDDIHNIKNMLVRYNLLQANFFQKMYDALSNIEDKLHKRKNNKKYKTNQQSQHVKKYNLKHDVNKYVRNINYNLNKLKDLVSRFSPKDRRKRHTMRDDDAVEYLLTLMEYLLKRNNPLDTPPVNDGIDLLIDAIRNAPDIKPIKKKVLKYTPTTPLAEIENSTEVNEDTSITKNNNDSNEDLKSTTKPKTEEGPIDSELIIGEVKRIKDFQTDKPAMADLSELFTEYPSKVYMATYNVFDNTEPSFFEAKSEIEDTTVLLQSSTTEKADSKKKVDTLFIAENNMKPLRKQDQKTTAEYKTLTQGESNIVLHTTEDVKLRHFSPNVNGHIQKGVKPPKTKLDLINEAYEEEMNEEKIMRTTVIPSQHHNKLKGETGKRDKIVLSKVVGGDVSSITKEVTDADKETRNQGDIIYRKQMDLLSSLDYGTDKSIADDSDSKDSSPLDRIKSREENATSENNQSRHMNSDEDSKYEATSKSKQYNGFVAESTTDSTQFEIDFIDTNTKKENMVDLSDVYPEFKKKNAFDRTTKPYSIWNDNEEDGQKPKKASIIIKVTKKDSRINKKENINEKEKGIQAQVIYSSPFDLLNSLDYGIDTDVIKDQWQ